MHQKYKTNAFVIKSVPRGEDARFLTLLTEKFGLIRAEAKGIRKEKSKKRYALQDFSYANVSLVKGRYFWLITNATPISSFFYESEQSNFYGKIFNLINRLIPEEDQTQRIFEIVKSASELLEQEFNEDVIENLTALRILHELGYVGEETEIGYCFDPDFSAKELIEKAEKDRKKIISIINLAIKESQL